METMGFPSRYVSWLQALYSITVLSPMNGNTPVGDITDVGSLRGGCPLSVHLFAIFIEPLLVALTNNLEGILLHGHKVAVRGFVDDTAVFVKTDKDITSACQLLTRRNLLPLDQDALE